MIHAYKWVDSVLYLKEAALVPIDGAAGSGEHESFISTSPEWLDEGR